MKNKNINFNKVIFIIFMSFSMALLPVYLMIRNITFFYQIITLIITFICVSIYLHKNLNRLVELFRKNKLHLIISFIVSIIIFLELSVSFDEDIGEVTNRFLGIKEFYYMIFPGMWLLIFIVFINIYNWIRKFINKMDLFEKRLYVIISVIMIVILFFAYSNKQHFYHEYNKVYSIDSGLVYDDYLPDAHYYDIRHPLTSFITFPVYSVVDFLFSDNLKPIIIQFINIQMLIFIGFELKRLTNSKLVFIFYILSFPAMIFMLFVEKYIMSVFLMVTYLYNIFIEKKDSDGLLIFSIGTMPTNIFIMVSEFFRKIKFEEKMRNLNKILFLAVIVIILTGRLPFLSSAVNDLAKYNSFYGMDEYTLVSKFNSTTKMITHSFIALPSSEQILTSLLGYEYKAYVWNDITGSVSYIGLIIIFVILVGFIDIFKQKKKVYYSFFSAFIFSFILFIILGWDVHESPLFSICFSWAIIPLFVYGFERILKKLKLGKNYRKFIYLFLLSIIIMINVCQLVNIYFYIQ